MPPFPPSPLVSTTWLAGQLSRPDLVILDTSWYLPVTGRIAHDEYRASHIPGAVFFDLDQASDPRSALPHMLPTAAEFAAHVGGVGVDSGSEVVVYDGSGSNLSAARAWWMFRVFGHERVGVLDGGLGKWRAEGRVLESGERARQPARFSARLDRSRIRDSVEVQRALATGGAQVVDLRSAGRFAGTEPEPRAGLASGHMPGAVSLPYTGLVHSDGTVLEPEELRGALAAAGVRLDRPVIATCGSGVTACNLLLALDRLGHPDASLYDGSWTEWVSSRLPVVQGTEPGHLR
jgi:thiosulfate/3-mercaptopyruvate sulfurtransferase